MTFSELEQTRAMSWAKSRAHVARSLCLIEDCRRYTAKNHLLQRVGVLEQIMDSDRRIWELKTSKFPKQLAYYSFHHEGWNDAFAINAYCSACDNQLFKTIEEIPPKSPSKLTERDAIAYSLRPIAHEIRKKEGNLRYFSSMGITAIPHRVRPDNVYTKEEAQIAFLKHIHNITLRAERGLSWIARPTSLRGVAAASMLIRPIPVHGQISWNVINIVPRNNGCEIIATCFSDDVGGNVLLKSIASVSEKQLRVLLSDILIHQIEDWCISPLVHEKKGPHITKLVGIYKNGSPDLFMAKSGIDLFEHPTEAPA